jgi:ATP/ADP translocase
MVRGTYTLTFLRMQTNVLTDPALFNPENIKPRKAKAKLGFVESIKVVFSSGYVAKIAIMVVGYGMVINFMVCLDIC